MRSKNLGLEVLLCNSGHEVHRSLSQWSSLRIDRSHAQLQTQPWQEEGACLKATKRDSQKIKPYWAALEGHGSVQGRYREVLGREI